MYAVMTNYNAYIRNKNLPIINSADKSSPTGLFSKEIFGITEEERSSKEALINLHCWVMRPIFVARFRSTDRAIARCVTSTSAQGDFYIRDGEVFEAPPGFIPEPGDLVGGGPRFLYDNWDKINTRQWEQDFGKEINKVAKSAISKFTREQIFKHYQSVIAIGNREEDDDSRILVNEINIYLADIIKYSNILSTVGDKADMGINVKTRDIECLIQQACNTYYDFMFERNLKPKAIGRKQILSRRVDNSSRTVLLPSVWTSRKLGKGLIKFRETGMPIHLLLQMYRDTVIKFSKNFIDLLYDRNCFPSDTTQDLLAYYDVEFLSDAIDKMEDPYFRVQPFPAICNGGTEFKNIELDYKVIEDGIEHLHHKPLVWLEFFYIVCESFANLKKSRATSVTRYPVDSQLSQQFLNPVALTLAPHLLRPCEVLGFKYELYFPFCSEWVMSHYDEKIFETGSRMVATTTTGFNGKRLPLYRVIYN